MLKANEGKGGRVEGTLLSIVEQLKYFDIERNSSRNRLGWC